MVALKVSTLAGKMASKMDYEKAVQSVSARALLTAATRVTCWVASMVPRREYSLAVQWAVAMAEQ